MASKANNTPSTGAEFARRLEKRFSDLSTRADSIQQLSQYAIHHKAEHKMFIQTWERYLKSHSEPEKRIALFYVCNDIVQNCRRKGADVYVKDFDALLPSALSLLTDSSVVPKVERVLKIWAERHIFHQASIQSFSKVLGSKITLEKESKGAPIHHPRRRSALAQPALVPSVGGVDETVSSFSVSDIISRFKSDSLIEKIRAQNIIDSDINGRTETIKNLDFDASDTHVINHLKNKSEGNEFCERFERSYTFLESFVSLLEKQSEGRRKLVETLENAEVFYDTQYTEVKRIAHIYNKYLSNVNQVIKKVSERLDSLPSPPSNDEANTPSTVDSESMDIESDNNNNNNNNNNNIHPSGTNIFAASDVFSMLQLPQQAMSFYPPNDNNLSSNNEQNFVENNEMMANIGQPPPMPPRMMPPIMIPPPPVYNPNQQSPCSMFNSPPPRFASPRIAGSPTRPLLPPRPPQQMISPRGPPPTIPTHNVQSFPGPFPGQDQQFIPMGQGFPPPPQGSSGNSLKQIPTVINRNPGMMSPTGARMPPSSPTQQFPFPGQQQRPPFVPGGRRKRSLEGSGEDGGEGGPFHGFNHQPSESLVPAEPVMPSTINNNGGARISTIVGIRRTSNPNTAGDPRLSSFVNRGRGGRGRGSGGGPGFVNPNFQQ